jgi:predicted XRE-type DNA-binding protein
MQDRDHLEDWISQAEAPRLRGVSRQAIAKLPRRNRLSAREIADRIVVRRSEVEAFVPHLVATPPKVAAAGGKIAAGNETISE